MNWNRITSTTTCGLLLLATSATRPLVTRPDLSSTAQNNVDACSLLTAADASKALEASSVPGKRIVASSPAGCVWSADPAASDSSRRVALVTHSLRAFQIAKSPAIKTIKVEPVTGIGDEAFYQFYPSASPFLFARKGNTAFSVRILRGTRSKPFTVEQEKSKEAALAKAAVARL